MKMILTWDQPDQYSKQLIGKFQKKFRSHTSFGWKMQQSEKVTCIVLQRIYDQSINSINVTIAIKWQIRKRMWRKWHSSDYRKLRDSDNPVHKRKIHWYSGTDNYKSTTSNPHNFSSFLGEGNFKIINNVWKLTEQGSSNLKFVFNVGHHKIWRTKISLMSGWDTVEESEANTNLVYTRASVFKFRGRGLVQAKETEQVTDNKLVLQKDPLKSEASDCDSQCIDLRM